MMDVTARPYRVVDLGGQAHRYASLTKAKARAAREAHYSWSSKVWTVQEFDSRNTYLGLYQIGPAGQVLAHLDATGQPVRSLVAA